MNQRGFILPALPLMGYAAIAAGVVIVGLGIAVKVQSARLESAQIEAARVKGEYTAFKAGVERIGREQEARNKETEAKQEKINAARYKGLQDRYAALDARYGRLRQSAGSSSGSGGVQPIPDSPVCSDAGPNRDQLLSVLQAADRNTETLIQLQTWVREQQAVK